MTVPTATGSRDSYSVRVTKWRHARDDGLRLPWILGCLSIGAGLFAFFLKNQLPWIWYPAAVPLIGCGATFGLYRRRLQRLANELGLICWHCGNIAVESPNYRTLQDPERVVREGRCLSCFRKVDEPEQST
jgi:hypothetical protein